MPYPTATEGSSYATREQIVRIASRLIAAYLLLWTADDMTMLPQELLSVAHYLHQSTAVGFSTASALNASYFLRDSILYLAANTFRIGFLLLGAGWFYRCGPRIYTFFCPPEPPTQQLTNS